MGSVHFRQAIQGMAAEFRPDWRDFGAYRPLLGCDAALHAWEWLRRDNAYQDAYARRDHSLATQFGLHLLENPARWAADARPLWMEAIDPFVIAVRATPSTDAEALDPRRCGPIICACTQGPNGEHIFLGDGRRTLRLDLLSGTLGAGPVRLSWRMPQPAKALPAIMALRRFSIWCQTGSLVDIGFPSAARAARWMTLLRVRDAIETGASQREIAACLFGSRHGGARWRIENASYRLRVQRLVRSSRLVALRGAAELLRPPSGWRG
jgi:hypothetical protein